MLGFLIQIIGVVISLCGWLQMESATLVFVGTGMILLIDLIGIITGELKSLMTTIIGAIAGAAAFPTAWQVGACLGICIETIIMSTLALLLMLLAAHNLNHPEND